MSRVLTPTVAVVVHPIDVAKHLSYPPGWRWAVMVGGVPPAHLDYCANAGWCPDEQTALGEGEQNGATAAKALRMMGCPAEYRVMRLTWDPVPSEADERPLAILREG